MQIELKLKIRLERMGSANSLLTFKFDFII